MNMLSDCCTDVHLRNRLREGNIPLKKAIDKIVSVGLQRLRDCYLPNVDEDEKSQCTRQERARNSLTRIATSLVILVYHLRTSRCNYKIWTARPGDCFDESYMEHVGASEISESEKEEKKHTVLFCISSAIIEFDKENKPAVVTKAKVFLKPAKEELFISSRMIQETRAKFPEVPQTYPPDMYLPRQPGASAEAQETGAPSIRDFASPVPTLTSDSASRKINFIDEHDRDIGAISGEASQTPIAQRTQGSTWRGPYDGKNGRLKEKWRLSWLSIGNRGL